MRENPIDLLFIGNDLNYAEYLSSLLNSNSINFKLHHTKNINEGLEYLTKENVSAILLDFSLFDDKNIDSFKHMQEESLGFPIIALVDKKEDIPETSPDAKGMEDYLIKKELTPEILTASLKYSLKHRELKKLLEYRVAFETVITTISTNFINLAPDEIQKGIRYALQVSGEFLGMEHSSVFLLSDEVKISKIYEWCAEGISSWISHFERKSFDIFPWLKNKILNGETVRICHIDELPIDASSERNECQLLRVKSFGVVPMVYDNLVSGFLEFDSVEAKDWTTEDVRLINMVGEIIVNSLERNRKEEAIVRAKKEWERTFDIVPDLIMVLDEQYRVVRVNNAMAHRMGVAPRDMIGKPCYLYCMANNEPASTCPHTLLMNDGKEHTVEIYIDKLGGYFLLSVSPIYNQEGKLIGSVHIARDISDRKRIEEELSRLASFPQLNPYPIIEIDFTGKITYLNTAAVNQFPDIMKFGAEHQIVKILISAISIFEQKKKELYVIEIALNGKVYEQHISYIPESERLRSYVVDITEKKQTEEFKKAKEYAEASNRAKSEFLATMSHELRTPLNSILGFSEVLRDENFGGLNDKQKEYLRDIYLSGKHLLYLINDILDLSKIEAGKMELQLGDVDLKELLENSILTIKEKAFEQRQNLSVNISENIPKIPADSRKIKQIMYNFLSNAVKFTPEGGSIGIEAEIFEDKEVLVSVWDTGIGIEDENKDKIFKKFEQIDSSYSRKYEGTGLGLSLTKSLVELHGGKIWFESEGKNKGSRFNFTLPLKPAFIRT